MTVTHLNSEDTLKNPVTLKIVDEIPAGGVSKIKMQSGQAAKILTGAMISDGADAVVKY